jgi:cytochrome c-type biogenesis protein
MSGIAETVQSGPFLLAAALSLAAGAVSFASPCVVPLVPGYLSYLAGLVGAEAAAAPPGGAVAAGSATPAGSTATAGSQAPDDRGSGVTAPSRAGRRVATGNQVRRRAVTATALFVAGFTLVFAAQWVLVLGVSRALQVNLDLLTRIGGAVTIVMGFVMLGFFRPLQREWRLGFRPTGRLLGPPLLGVVFGLGWVTCLGPTLAAVISLSVSSEWNGNAWRGLFLILFYCAGLGVPFLLVAFGFGWAGGALALLRRHARAVQVGGAVLLILLGIAMVTGLWADLITLLRNNVGDGGVLL